MSASHPDPVDAAAARITAEGLLEHIRVLASDRFEGRAPGTAGEALTVEYLVEAFRALGLAPGNPDGGWVQEVPMVGFRSSPEVAFRTEQGTLDLRAPDEYVAWSLRAEPRVEVVDSEVVFVGYGVRAPEYGWDDYEGVDVRGRTVVILVNDPPVPDPADPSRLDPATFRGRAMTYYGRWTYKFEEAARRGAAAALIVHETEPAGYPYSVVVTSNGNENFDIASSDAERPAPAVRGWLTLEATRRLFTAAGKDFDALKRAAASREFRPVALGARASLRLGNRMREVTSRNVLARLDGRDPARRGELVVYSAHWDHLGRESTPEGDRVYGGANDNASGIAALLALGRAFRALPEPPARSILFLATTAEEKGLLGAKYYASHPLYPLARTVANVNIDGLNVWGPARDVVVTGWEMTTLQDVLAREAGARGRTLTPDPEPEKGFYYRADQFEFAKRGVPALYTGAGIDFPGRPEGWGRARRDEYTANDYHQPSDRVRPDWDLAGAAEDVRLLFRVGLRVADAPDVPEWKPGSEFRARREESRGGG